MANKLPNWQLAIQLAGLEEEYCMAVHLLQKATNCSSLLCSRDEVFV